MNADNLRPRTIYDIHYITRDLTGHDDRESGIITAFWTGEIDTWGKLTIKPINGGQPLYLFRDEIKEAD